MEELTNPDDIKNFFDGVSRAIQEKELFNLQRLDDARKLANEATQQFDEVPEYYQLKIRQISQIISAITLILSDPDIDTSAFYKERANALLRALKEVVPVLEQLEKKAPARKPKRKEKQPKTFEDFVLPNKTTAAGRIKKELERMAKSFSTQKAAMAKLITDNEGSIFLIPKRSFTDFIKSFMPDATKNELNQIRDLRNELK